MNTSTVEVSIEVTAKWRAKYLREGASWAKEEWENSTVDTGMIRGAGGLPFPLPWESAE